VPLLKKYVLNSIWPSFWQVDPIQPIVILHIFIVTPGSSIE